MTMMVVEENRVGVKKVMFVVDIRQFGSWQAEAGGQDGFGPRLYIFLALYLSLPLTDRHFRIWTQRVTLRFEALSDRHMSRVMSRQKDKKTKQTKNKN